MTPRRAWRFEIGASARKLRMLARVGGGTDKTTNDKTTGVSCGACGARRATAEKKGGEGEGRDARHTRMIIVGVCCCLFGPGR